MSASETMPMVFVKINHSLPSELLVDMLTDYTSEASGEPFRRSRESGASQIFIWVGDERGEQEGKQASVFIKRHWRSSVSIFK